MASGAESTMNAASHCVGLTPHCFCARSRCALAYGWHHGATSCRLARCCLACHSEWHCSPAASSPSCHATGSQTAIRTSLLFTAQLAAIHSSLPLRQLISRRRNLVDAIQAQPRLFKRLNCVRRPMEVHAHLPIRILCVVCYALWTPTPSYSVRGC